MKKNIQRPILPPRIFPGDRVGIVAPASPFDRSRFQKGVSVLESMGFHPVFSDALFEADRYLAGTDAHRARAINAMFADSRIRAIWCARGGYGSLRILSLIDYEAVKSNPKGFIGCSDVSAILNAFYFKCGLATFHGPMVVSLGEADDVTQNTLSALLSSKGEFILRPKNPHVIHPGAASGVVSGGNLTTLCHLVGTPHQPDFSGHILLLEDTHEAPYRIDRMLTQMRLAGCFDRLAGILLGSFENCGNSDEIYSIVSHLFSDLDIPILAGFEIGHGKPNLTVPLGVEAVLSADEKLLSFHRPFFAD